MIAFSTEERRASVLSYVIDLYAGDLDKSPDAVSLKNAYLDKSGYYAQARKDAAKHPKTRQLDFFGGLDCLAAMGRRSQTEFSDSF